MSPRLTARCRAQYWAPTASAASCKLRSFSTGGVFDVLESPASSFHAPSGAEMVEASKALRYASPPHQNRGDECDRQRSAEHFDLAGSASVVTSEALRHEGGVSRASANFIDCSAIVASARAPRPPKFRTGIVHAMWPAGLRRISRGTAVMLTQRLASWRGRASRPRARTRSCGAVEKAGTLKRRDNGLVCCMRGKPEPISSNVLP